MALARLEVSRLRDISRRFVLQTAAATTRLLDSLASLARKSSAHNDPQAPIPPLTKLEIARVAGLAAVFHHGGPQSSSLSLCRGDLPPRAVCFLRRLLTDR